MVTKKWGVKNWREKKNQKSWKKSGCEKDAASELLFGLGVNRLKWPEMERRISIFEAVASELLFSLGVNERGCEKDAASELLFGLLGVNRLKWPEMELIFF